MHLLLDLIEILISGGTLHEHVFLEIMRLFDGGGLVEVNPLYILERGDHDLDDLLSLVRVLLQVPGTAHWRWNIVHDGGGEKRSRIL